MHNVILERIDVERVCSCPLPYKRSRGHSCPIQIRYESFALDTDIFAPSLTVSRTSKEIPAYGLTHALILCPEKHATLTLSTAVEFTLYPYIADMLCSPPLTNISILRPSVALAASSSPVLACLRQLSAPGASTSQTSPSEKQWSRLKPPP